MLGARSWSNLVSSLRIVLRRRASRRAVYPVLDWRLPLCFCLSMILISVLVLDAPLASFRGLWSPGILLAAESMTDVGWGGWYIVPWVVVALAVNLTDWQERGRRQLLVLYNWTCLAIFMLVTAGLSGILVNVVKQLVGRARPHFFPDSGVLSFKPLAMDAYYASFPSGHSTTIGAVAGALILFLPRSRYVVIPLAIWVGSTRAIVGAHYASDVVAGLAFGFACTVVAAIVFARLGYVFRQRPSGLPEMKRSFRIFW